MCGGRRWCGCSCFWLLLLLPRWRILTVFHKDFYGVIVVLGFRLIERTTMRFVLAIEVLTRNKAKKHIPFQVIGRID